MAAQSKKEQCRSTDDLVSDPHAKWTTSKPPTVVDTEDLLNRLNLLVSTTLLTGDVNNAETARVCIENLRPELKTHATTSLTHLRRTSRIEPPCHSKPASTYAKSIGDALFRP